ncbi:low-density lipoprotein receptor-related protein 3-like [Galendromus occidentalis]|uniref:Low-density lipoprotein receptor-related protein 3-like n=1 Tax=Galendromus occidentalis TaxID=34638 RepID=A0AAJ7PAH3_9ACAR|nr:low-density lipoprotein receptor-related protein 3-like [Galendromus occidentalis]
MSPASEPHLPAEDNVDSPEWSDRFNLSLALSVSGARRGLPHPIHNYSICGNYTEFHTDGFILSPDMSLIQHENVNCTIDIRGNDSQMVTIHFEDFVIDTTVPHANDSLVSCGGFAERVSDCCLGAMLKVSEIGPPRRKYVAFKDLAYDQIQQNIYCGSGKKRLPQPFLSAGSGVSLQFVSIANLAPKGRNITRMFKLRYYVSKAGSDCGPHEFQCQSDKKCIPTAWRCNQNRECEDGSDERDCTQTMYNHPATKRSRWIWCDQDHIFCGMHSKDCFATAQRCNGVRDCSNGFDEDQCPPGSNYVLCKNFIGNATRCGSTQYCYDQAAQSCDGVLDCPLGDDERGCDPCPELIRCGKHASSSNYGGLCGFNDSQRCNGIDDCHDGFDEMNCLAARCGPNWGSFLCGDGRCISDERRCDHMPDCSGAEDEMYCIKNSVITAAIMGSLVCGILVVIAISCTCRLYALRLVSYQRQQNCSSGVPEDRRRRSSISDSDLLRFDALQDLYCYYGFRDPPPPYSVAVAGDPPVIPPPPGTSGRRRRSRTHHTRMYTSRRSSNNLVTVEATIEQGGSQAEPAPPSAVHPDASPSSPPPQPVSPKPGPSQNEIQAPTHEECSQRDVREHLNKTENGFENPSPTGEIEFSVLPPSNSTVIAVGTDAASSTTDDQPLIVE